MSILDSFSRLSTQVVTIGNIAVGGNNPIRIQSMTSTDTLDIKKTVDQSKRMIEAGCELVRITVPNMKAVAALEKIKNCLRQQNITTPLIADVHFSKNVAEAVAPIVEKVRINPGNYLDKKQFIISEYTDEEYANELERIEIHFTPLVEICKRHQTAIRIGTNHGSLSDRIVNRYGDSPLGMVQSALEFIDICQKLNFAKIVLSMKSSNTLVMTAAYRLLVSKLEARGKLYPLHLGVTEAGSEEEGRVKSAVGIGTLLLDGIGDTIRVSLTEDPEKEIPVCQNIIQYINIIPHKKQFGQPLTKIQDLNNLQNSFDFIQTSEKNTIKVNEFGDKQVPKVYTTLSLKESPLSLVEHGYQKITDTGKWVAKDIASDGFYLDNTKNALSSLFSTKALQLEQLHEQLDLPLNTSLLIPFSAWKNNLEDRSANVLTPDKQNKQKNSKKIVYFNTFKDYLNNSNELTQKYSLSTALKSPPKI